MAPKLFRRCISCQKLAPREEFLRVVRLHNQTDASNKLQIGKGIGRSAYICQRLECLQIAQKKGRLGKALRTPVSPEVFIELSKQLSVLGYIY